MLMYRHYHAYFHTVVFHFSFTRGDRCRRDSVDVALTKSDIHAQLWGGFVTRIQRWLRRSTGKYFLTGGLPIALYSPLVRQVPYILFV